MTVAGDVYIFKGVVMYHLVERYRVGSNELMIRLCEYCKSHARMWFFGSLSQPLFAVE